MNDERRTVRQGPQRPTTTCPFCLNGCESQATFNYQYRMEYAADAKVNKGRLCPRGNSASLVIDHPQRLAYPLLDGKEVSWQRAIDEARQVLAGVEPTQVAVVYSRGLAETEVRLVRGFAQAIRTPNLVCGYVEPDNSFDLQLDGVKAASLDDVRAAKAMLLVGDVFSTSPVASGPILDARYADRKNRLVVIDSIKTREAGFAHLFLQVKPGTEGFALLALAAAIGKARDIDGGRYVGLAGLDSKQVEQAAAILKSGTPGFVGSAMCIGRTINPRLYSLASQTVAVAAKMPFTGFGEARVPAGSVGFGQLRQMIAEDKVKALFWFGGLYPYSYPELMPELSKVRFRAATSIFRPGKDLPGLVLPVPSELEKEATGRSYWGEVQRRPLAGPYSGTKQVAWILGQLAQAGEVAESSNKPESAADCLKLADSVAGKVKAAGTGEWLAIGEKKAIGIGGFYDPENELCINPQDAKSLGVAAENYVLLTSLSGARQFRPRVTDAVPAGVVSVGVNAHTNRALFPIETHAANGAVAMPPVSVGLAKAEAVAVPVTEKRASA